MALSNGFVVLHRSLLSWGWHADPSTGWLFVNLIMMANCAPVEWKGIKIERGQLVTGRKALAEQTGLSEQSIRTALNHLKSTGEITIESTNKYSLITLVNYRKFQDIPETSTNKPTSKLTSNQPATNQQLTTREQGKQREQGSNMRAKRFTPPTVDDVRAYCEERGNHVDAQRFVDFYTANGWKVGKNSMQDWKAAVRTWERSDAQQKGANSFGTLYGDY